MDNQQEMELQLWEYIDGSLLDAERNAVEKLIADNSFWKQRYHELLDLHQSINLIELEQPSLRFTKNVMDEIARYQIAPATKKIHQQQDHLGYCPFLWHPDHWLPRIWDQPDQLVSRNRFAKYNWH